MENYDDIVELHFIFQLFKFPLGCSTNRFVIS